MVGKWDRHEHKWMFLIAKGSYQPAENGLYEFIEYAYLICNGCNNVIKERVKTKAEVDQNGKSD